MELKQEMQRFVVAQFALLIVPYGIETKDGLL